MTCDMMHDGLRAVVFRAIVAAEKPDEATPCALLVIASVISRFVEISHKVAASFEQIAAKARSVDQYVAEIAEASSEQAQGVSQLNTAISQMDQVTQSNARSRKKPPAAPRNSAARPNHVWASPVRSTRAFSLEKRPWPGRESSQRQWAHPPSEQGFGRRRNRHFNLLRSRSAARRRARRPISYCEKS